MIVRPCIVTDFLVFASVWPNKMTPLSLLQRNNLKVWYTQFRNCYFEIYIAELKVQLSLCTPNRQMAEWTIARSFLTSALYRMWPASRPERFTPESTWRTNLTGGRFGPRASLKALEKRKYFAHAECGTMIIHLSGLQPEHCTDRTVRLILDVRNNTKHCKD